MKKLLLLAAVSVAAGTAHAQDAWTLQDCIDYALSHNVTLRKNATALRTAEVSLKEAKAQRLPSVSGSLSQSVQYRPFQESVTNYVNSGMTQSSANKATESGSYGVNASWTLWDGQRTRLNMADAELSRRQAEQQSLVTGNSLQEQIAQLYVQILYTQEALSVNRQLLQQDSVVCERGRVMVSTGKMSKADLAELEAQYAQGSYDLVNAGTQIDNYKTQLKQLLELQPTDDIRIADPQASDAAVLRPVPAKSEVIAAALRSRPELLQDSLAIEQSRLQTRIARAGYLPTISLTGSLGDSHMTGSSRTWAEQMKYNFNAVAGLGITIPIYDRRQTRSAVERAQLQELNAQLDRQDTQKQIWSSVENYWLQAVSSQAKFRAAQASVKATQTSYDLCQEQFRLGLKNITELLQSRARLLSARQSLLQDKYTTLLNTALLRFYAGETISLN